MSLLRALNNSMKLISVSPKILSRPLSSLTTKEIEDKDKPDFTIQNPYKKERRECILCKHKITADYKNVKLLSQFQSPYTGRIYGRHITGLCRKQQSIVEAEIIKAQNCGYMPYYYRDKSFLKDPKLFNPENPIRPHAY